MSTIINFIWNVFIGSLFNYHTYVGVILGILFTPFWKWLYEKIRAFIIKKEPGLAVFVSEVEGGVIAIRAIITPVQNEVIKK